MVLHTDGAEFFTNSEYIVWSMSSLFSEAHIWDSKFPICILPHDSLGTEHVKRSVQETVAAVVGWSLQFAANGLAPTVGFYNEPLEDYRKKLGGQTLALGWKACYWGFRHDEKARKEANYFPRSYQHSYICVRCMAQKHHKGWCPLLSYKNSHPGAAHKMTRISPSAIEKS